MSQSFQLGARLYAAKEALTKQNRSSALDKVEATVAIMLLESQGTLETLLIQRTERHDDPWSGQIGLPGGRVKGTDASTKAALEREVSEEVGVPLISEGVELGALSLGHPMRRIEMRVQPWVYAMRRRPHVNVGPEVTAAFWVEVHQLKPSLGMRDVSVRGQTWKVESFLVEGKVVWGFTFRVLTELLDLLGLSPS